MIVRPTQMNTNSTICFYEIDIPDWVKNVGYWWIEGTILDEDFAQVVNYLIEKKIISLPIETENEI